MRNNLSVFRQARIIKTVQYNQEYYSGGNPSNLSMVTNVRVDFSLKRLSELQTYALQTLGFHAEGRGPKTHWSVDISVDTDLTPIYSFNPELDTFLVCAAISDPHSILAVPVIEGGS
jgi:hypothetical protein